MKLGGSVADLVTIQKKSLSKKSSDILSKY